MLTIPHKKMILSFDEINFTAFFTKIDKKKLANFSNNSMQFILLN
jgi:hypothetical protein